MNFQEKTILGRTAISVGRLGIASSYGAPAEAYEEAFEKGCNYFTIGSFIQGRRKGMVQAIRNICSLKKLGLGYVDVLYLGHYRKKPREGILNWALELKDKGLVRFIGLSSHNRSLFPRLSEEGIIDVFHIRYNAANRGAENDLFPYLNADNKPGVVIFTATRWGQLLKKGRIPPDENPLSATDCYRFVLSNPSVDLCLTGTRSLEMMRENLNTLELGPLNEDEMQRIRRIGDHVYGKPRT